MKKYTFPIVLVVIGLILNFAFSGHGYIAYTLYLIALLTVFYRRAGKRSKAVVTVLLSICLIYFIIVEVPIVGASRGDPDCDADCIIVLGALVRGETPSLSMVERTRAALDYMNGHPDTLCIVSGGQGDREDISEAEAMYRWLVDNGADPQRIVLEDKSTSTRENIEFSMKLAGEAQSFAVVSSEYHLYRAKLIGEELGLTLSGIPAHTTWIDLRLNYFIREAFAVTYLWVFGN